MALTIEGATVGYDSGEVQTAINNLHTKCIADTKNLMTKEMSTLRTAVDNAWVGQSAESFKNNLQADLTTISNALDETFNVLQSELFEIVNKMDEMDQNLVKERGAE